MAILKCKMCGGSLNIVGDNAVCECEFCGTQQTVPKMGNDANVAELFNRATEFRNACDFDRAEHIYEQIIESDPNEAEAYWGLILCKYGIEYVKDPRTQNRIPTCHRASYDAITVDMNYKNALKYANVVQKPIYEAEAKQIDEIQKGILTLARDEEPYDIFICYKETDKMGKRTPDSVLANDIYYQLTNMGYKVFYAAITLEDKLGSAYEPYIFAALNSAKVMLVIGTKPEYFKAVWVKNEWSRYLQIIKNDMKKVLIPCYRDMDAYELPEEFAHIQALDMAKIGFINDVERACIRVCGNKKEKEEPKAPAYQQQTSTSGVNVRNLIRRMYDFIEENEVSEAQDLVNRILDEDCTCIDAHIVNLLIENKVRRVEDLGQKKVSTDTRAYRSFAKYANPGKKAEIDGYINEYYENTYSKATKLFEQGNFAGAIDVFKTIVGYKDVRAQIKNCNLEKVKANSIKDKESLESAYKNAMFLYESGKYNEAVKAFSELDVRCSYTDFAKDSYEREDYPEFFEEYYTFETEDGIYYKDGAKYIAICKEQCKEIELEAKYNRAVDLFNRDKFNDAIREFEALGDYKDSLQYIEDAKDGILVFDMESKYEFAKRLFNCGRFAEAKLKFQALEGYKDSNEYIKKCEDAIDRANGSEKLNKVLKKLVYILGIILTVISFGQQIIKALDFDEFSLIITPVLVGGLTGAIVSICANKKQNKTLAKDGFSACIFASLVCGATAAIATAVICLILIFRKQEDNKKLKTSIYVAGGITLFTVPFFNFVSYLEYWDGWDIIDVFGELGWCLRMFFRHYLVEVMPLSLIIGAVLGIIAVAISLIKGHKKMALNGFLACFYATVVGGWMLGAATLIVFAVIAFILKGQTNKKVNS